MTEWIQYRGGLPNHFKIVAMSAWLCEQPAFCAWVNKPAPTRRGRRAVPQGVNRDPGAILAMGGMLEFWCLANSSGTVDGNDLILRGVCVNDVDQMGSVPLLGQAMALVGFVREEKTSAGIVQLRLPNWLDHNIPAQIANRREELEKLRKLRWWHKNKQQSSDSDTNCSNKADQSGDNTSLFDYQTKELDAPLTKTRRATLQYSTVKQEESDLAKSNEDENEIGSEAKMVFDAWNELGKPFPSWKTITDARWKAARARCADPFWRENWREALARMAKSSFCRGKSQRGWVADIEFFLRPDSLTKILEGKYDDPAGAELIQRRRTEAEIAEQVAKQRKQIEDMANW